MKKSNVKISGAGEPLEWTNLTPEHSLDMERLLNNLPGMAYQCVNDNTWKMEYVSQGCEELTGYKQSDLLNNLKVSYADIIHPDDRDYVWGEVQKAIQNSLPFEVEYRIITADGVVKYVWERGFGKKTQDGNFWVEGFITDISGRKKTEKALRTSEEKYRVLVDSANAAFAFFDTAGKVVVVNEYIAKLFGLTSEEMIGRPFSDFLPGQTDYHLQMFATVMREKKKTVLEGQFMFPDGKHWISSSIQPVCDSTGVVIGVQVVGYDITERIRNEEALRESKELLQEIAANFPAYLAVVEKDLTFSFASGKELKKRNLPPQHFEGLSLEQIAGEQASLILPKYQKAFEGEGTNFELSLGNQDLYFQVIPMMGEDREVHKLLVAVDDVTERKQTEKNLRQRLERMRALYEVERAIQSSSDLRFTQNILLEKLMTQLEVDAVAVVLFETGTHQLKVILEKGFTVPLIQDKYLQIGEDLAGQIVLNRDAIFIPDINHADRELKIPSIFAKEGFVAYHGVPLLAKGQVLGVLEVFHRSPLAPDQEWFEFMATLAGHAAIAIDSALLVENLRRLNTDLSMAYDSTLEGWSKALELRDRETVGHSNRVVELTIKLAREMGMQSEELVHLHRGALLHDIGKMGVPDWILQKPAPLNDEEWVVMRKHPRYALDWLSPIPFLRPALDVPYYHHEKWDGTGYPTGLKGEQIPLSARIFAITDVWDALTHERPYREAWTEKETWTYINNQSGRHFDPKVVEAFRKIMNWKADSEP